MKSATIRGIDSELEALIKQQSKEKNTSINQWIINTLRTATGLEKKKFIQEYSDLDKLAGTWNKNQADEFYKETQIFEKIDKDLWK